MKKNTAVFDLLWLSLGLGFIFLFFGSDHALFNPDESRYSEIAREMLASGDFITPRLNDLVFFDKPILYYWLQAFSMKWFGINEWALRFFPAVFGVIGCLCLYLTGYAMFSRKTGVYSALILASSPLYFFASHYANMDLEVAVLITACLCCCWVATNDKYATQRPWLLYSAYLFSALAILTKGLIGIVFPAMIISTWIVFTNQWQFIKQMRLFTGLILILAITLPWFYLVQKANPNFLHYFFVIQHFERFISSDFNSKSPIWFYLPIVLLGTFPWVFVIIPAMINASKRCLKDPSLLFLLLWAGLIFIFFSTPKSKLIGYILPVIPPLVLITGNYLVKTLSTPPKWTMRIILFSNFCISPLRFNSVYTLTKTI